MRQPIELPTLGATYQILTGNHQGETATVIGVREPSPNDPIVTAKLSTGMLTHWRPAWGVFGMPHVAALSASAR